MTHMIKLINLLAENNIPFQVIVNEELDNTKQVFIPNYINPMFDIVCNKYSYGNQEDLLEILYHNTNKCEGFLTAEDVYNIVKIS